MKLLNFFRRKPTVTTERPMWLVHFGENICKQLPAEGYKMCVHAEDWQPGYIYVPLGSVLVSADDEQGARDKALDYLCTLYPDADEQIAETLSA